MAIIDKVRKNQDYMTVSRVLDDLKLDWQLCAPIGKGHPYVRVGGLRWPLATSPGRTNPKAIEASLRRWLRMHGLTKSDDLQG
jgi:hypothetical protein